MKALLFPGQGSHKAGMASNHQNPYDQKVKIYQNFKPEDFREWWRTKIQFNYFAGKNGKNIKTFY